MFWLCTDHFVFASSQWEMMLHCNVISHWLGAYTKWTLLWRTGNNPGIIVITQIAIHIRRKFRCETKWEMELIHQNWQLNMYGFICNNENKCNQIDQSQNISLTVIIQHRNMKTENISMIVVVKWGPIWLLWAITSNIKCEMKLFTHSQTSMVQLLEFGNG